ncbi:MAG: TlpA disulfide reductase family protein [Thermoprotei archaeon]
MVKPKGKNRKEKNQNFIGFIALLSVVIFLIIVMYIMQVMNTQNTPVMVSNNILSIPLVGTDGRIYTLSNFTGKITLIEFMATWCPHCKNMIPVLKQVYFEFKNKINIVSIGPDASDNLDTLRTYKSEYNITWTILWDNGGVLAKKVNLQAYPTFMILSKNGEVLWSKVGEISADDLKAVISSHL